MLESKSINLVPFGHLKKRFCNSFLISNIINICYNCIFLKVFYTEGKIENIPHMKH